MPLANSSITSPRAGDRAHRQNRDPRDLTGKTYQRQHAEQDARKAAATVDIREVQRQAREAGFSEGWDAAIAWVIERMTDIGLDPDIFVGAGDDADELDEAAE